MPNCRDAKLLQGLVRQARKNRLVYLVLAERRLVTFKAEAAQPTPRSILSALGLTWSIRVARTASTAFRCRSPQS
jgi:hypothetical protein